MPGKYGLYSTGSSGVIALWLIGMVAVGAGLLAVAIVADLPALAGILILGWLALAAWAIIDANRREWSRWAHPNPEWNPLFETTFGWVLGLVLATALVLPAYVIDHRFAPRRH